MNFNPQMDGYLKMQVDREKKLNTENRKNARIIVAGHAKSNDDCADLLDKLGLMNED